MAKSAYIEHLPPPPADTGFGDDGSRPSGSQRRASITGVLVLLAAITTLFAAFTSAMIVRRGLADDWKSISLPQVCWLSSALLVSSSLCLESARRALRRGDRGLFTRFWTAGSLLGFGFLAGQYLAWRQLQAAGIYLATNPSSSFFYLFTVTHALHVGGGLLFLLYIEAQALRLRLGPAKRTAVDVAGIYWHFLGALWIYLMLLFRFWG